MPFELRYKETLLLSNNFTTSEFEAGNYRNGSMDGTRHFSFPYGEIRLTQWILQDIRIVYSEYDLTDYLTLDWKGDLEMVTMFFNLKGKLTLLANEMETPVEMSANHHNMFYGQLAEGQMKMEELQMRSFMIQLTRKTFMVVAGADNKLLNGFIENVKNRKTAILSEKNLEITLDMMNCINSMLHYSYAEPLRKMFLRAKAMELLVLQAECYNRSMQLQPRFVKTDYDRERILFARDYMLKHLEVPPSLTELSRIAGINEFKLKRGFREMFGQTVFGYLNDIRMELAKNDLLEKRKSITEIAFELGFSSVQHFSSAFKKKFGLSPRDV